MSVMEIFSYSNPEVSAILVQMADIYSESEVHDIFPQYPSFLADVIAISDYETVPCRLSLC